jgi:hypothetical protein
MNILILDVKKYIATFNKEAWYWLYQVDLEFKEYASSEDGIKEYKRIHYDVVIKPNKTKYYLFGKLHREEDLPAIIYADGSQEWYKNGLLHREGDLPAIIWADGTSEWWINGKLHRPDHNGQRDLPAYIGANGSQVWYINGIFLKKI